MGEAITSILLYIPHIKGKLWQPWPGVRWKLANEARNQQRGGHFEDLNSKDMNGFERKVKTILPSGRKRLNAASREA